MSNGALTSAAPGSGLLPGQVWDFPGDRWDANLQWDLLLSDITRYLNLITSEHRNKPNFITFISIFLQGVADLQANLAALPGMFDIDTGAGGVFLDQVGLWVGASRYLEVPIIGVYFSLDSTTLGLDQGSMQGSDDPINQLTVLSDSAYLTVIKAKITANTWDGSIPSAYSIWNTLFTTPMTPTVEILEGPNTLPTTDFSSGSSPNTTYVQSFDPELFVGNFVAQNIRVKFAGAAGNATHMTQAWLGHVGPNAFSFDGNQVQLTVGGKTQFTVPGGGTTATDYAAFNFDPTRPLLIAFNWSDANSNLGRNNSATGVTQYYSDGTHPNDAGTQIKSNYATAVTTNVGVLEIDGTAVGTLPISIKIHDLDNMHMNYELVGTADAVTQALFTNGLLDLRPAGVQIDSYIYAGNVLGFTNAFWPGAGSMAVNASPISHKGAYATFNGAGSVLLNHLG